MNCYKEAVFTDLDSTFTKGSFYWFSQTNCYNGAVLLVQTGDLLKGGLFCWFQSYNGFVFLV